MKLYMTAQIFLMKHARLKKVKELKSLICLQIQFFKKRREKK